MLRIKNTKLSILFLSTLVLTSLFISTFAATLSLTKIGSIDATGKNYSEWWYTSTSVTFQGTAVDGSQVAVKIGDTVNQVNVASGMWSYTLNGENKDYNVEISQGSAKIDFILHLGQVLPSNINSGTSQPAKGTIPDTGYNQIIAIGFGVGVILLASYFYFWGDTKKKSVFEARIIKED